MNKDDAKKLDGVIEMLPLTYVGVSTDEVVRLHTAYGAIDERLRNILTKDGYVTYEVVNRGIISGRKRVDSSINHPTQ